MALTQERLKELLSYDPLTGVFLWAKKTCKKVVVGKVAGCKAANGYIYIRLDGVLYLAHRLAFLFMTGEWPENHVDHVNGNTDQNQWCNLRPCDRSQNMCNSKKRANSLTPFKGVSFHKASGRFQVRVQANNKVHSLGYFASPEIAAETRDAAAKELHGEFARLNGAA